MAKRRMPAALRKYWAKRGHRKANPHRKRRHHRRANPHRAHHRRRHRNPMSLSSIKSGFVQTLMSGAHGALGAIGVDLAWGYAAPFIPSSLGLNLAPSSPGNLNYIEVAGKLVLSVLAGAVGGKVMPGKGRDIAVGSTAVVLHDAAKNLLLGAAPSLPLSGLGAYVGASQVVGYGATAVGTPQIGTGVPRTTNGVPSAHDLGSLGQYMSGGVGGWADGVGIEGDAW